MAAKIGYGTTFGIYNGSTYTAAALVTRVGIPGVDHQNVETTHMLSTNRYREFIPALRDAGEASFDLEFDPTGVSTLDTEADRNTSNSYRITFEDATTCTFSGIFSYALGDVTPDGLMTATATIKVSGEATWA